ncbi:MAG: PcfJ domain-containing protein [Roseburia sp.]|nr:PcfJ domain-containing protein [Roseburia sp.]
MLDFRYIKPIPQYIAKQIKRLDNDYTYQDGNVRFYAYLTKIKGELVKITVACKNYKQQWFCKQVAVHGVFSDKCLVRDMEYTLMGYSVGWYDLGLTERTKNFEDGRWHPAEDKYYDPIAFVVNKKYALKFDKFKYSAVDKYPYAAVLKYLRIYEQYPQAEYFVKLGLSHLATNKMLLRKAGKDKKFRKWLIRNAKLLRNDYGTLPYFSAQTIWAAYKKDAPILEMQDLERKTKELQRNYYYINTISKIIPKNEISKFLDYIEKQNINISSYADYVKACVELGLDMSLPKNRYPHDFKRWHDIRTDEYATLKALRDAEERKELYAKFSVVAEKYLPLQRDMEDAFIVVIAKSPAELIHEGDVLHHCVGRMNYDRRVAREESLIFFVRNKDNPDVPFVTLEYSLRSKRVLQCYGKDDNVPDDTVLQFVNKKWLPYANRKLKQIAA